MPDVVVSNHINDLLRSQSSSVSRSILGVSLIDNLSSNWQNTFTTVQSNSADWELGYTGYTGLTSLSANWQNAYNSVNNLSSSWSSGYTGYVSLTTLSSNWQNTYTTVQNYSAGWGSTSKADLSGAQFTGPVTAPTLSAQTLSATSIIRVGGTSSQFLKADGSVDTEADLIIGLGMFI